MIDTIVSDFSKVCLFAKDPSYSGGLNALNNRLMAEDPKYPFLDFFVVNEALLEYYRQLNRVMPIYMFTSETIQNHPALEPRLKSVFRGLFSAQELNLSKRDDKAYLSIVEMVGSRPGEVLYIDDKASNLEAAARAGLGTVLYTTNEELIRELDPIARSHTESWPQ